MEDRCSSKTDIQFLKKEKGIKLNGRIPMNPGLVTHSKFVLTTCSSVGDDWCVCTCILFYFFKFLILLNSRVFFVMLAGCRVWWSSIRGPNPRFAGQLGGMHLQSEILNSTNRWCVRSGNIWNENLVNCVMNTNNIVKWYESILKFNEYNNIVNKCYQCIMKEHPTWIIWWCEQKSITNLWVTENFFFHHCARNYLHCREPFCLYRVA